MSSGLCGWWRGLGHPHTAIRNLEGAGVKCDLCNQPATVHLTDIINGHKKEQHLCRSCAEAQQLFKNQEMNLSAILQTVIGQHIGPLTDELARLTCPECGIKYMEFRAEGRLGCAHDYQAFQTALEPLLLRIHRATRHVGKRPPNAQRNAARLAEILDLKRQQQRAVQQEAYEEAARLRDLIREKEAAYESG